MQPAIAHKKLRQAFSDLPRIYSGLNPSYCFFVAPFLAVPVFGAPVLGTAFFAGALCVPGAPLGLIRLRASSALNGNWRTDVCPVVLSVTSTRRFWARARTVALRLSC